MFDLVNQNNPIYVDVEGRLIFIRLNTECSYDEYGEVEDEETYCEGYIVDEQKALLILKQKKFLSTWDMKYIGLYASDGTHFDNPEFNLVRQFNGDIIKRFKNDYFC